MLNLKIQKRMAENYLLSMASDSSGIDNEMENNTGNAVTITNKSVPQSLS